MSRFIKIFPTKKRRKSKVLGTADKKRTYDIPLDKDSGAKFLITLSALMTFLAAIALATSLSLNHVSRSWSSGLENKITVEIPAESSDGTLRTSEELDTLASQTADKLRTEESVNVVTVLRQEDVQELISPWLGDVDTSSDYITLPRLLSLEMENTDKDTLLSLTGTLAEIDPSIQLDTHEEWLGSLLRLIMSVQFTAFIITLIVGITTITAIAGAMRARMDVHREDVELLHLMGAADSYIAKQFQRHAMIIVSKGAFIGLLLTVAFIIIMTFVLQDTGLETGQETALNMPMIILSITALALGICFIAKLAARHTVLRSLEQMP